MNNCYNSKYQRVNTLELGKMPGEANGSENYIPITPIEFSKLQKIESDGGNHFF